MSGGSYDYQYSRIEYLAEELDRQLENNFIEEKEVWNGKFTTENVDSLGDATQEERAKIIEEVTLLVKDLRSVAFRAKEFEWYQSGDTGATSYLRRLAEQDSKDDIQIECPCCGSFLTYKTEAIHCSRCAVTTEVS